MRHGVVRIAANLTPEDRVAIRLVAAIRGGRLDGWRRGLDR